MIRNILAVAALTMTAFAAEPPLLSLVPPDATAIGGLRVDRALASAIGRHLVAQIREDDPEFRKMVEATGFDPRRDVREVVVAQLKAHGKGGLVIARGVFNGPRIIAAAQAHGGIPGTYNGVPVIASKTGQLIAVLDGSTALLGEDAMVKYAIDHRSDTSVPATKLARKASTLVNSYDGWLVADGAVIPPAPAAGAPKPTLAMMEAIVETSAGIELGSTVRVTGEAVTRSEKDALALVDVIRFIVTMARNNVGTNPDMQKMEPVLNSLEVRAEAATVKVTVAVPEADLEQWIKPKRAPARAAAR